MKRSVTHYILGRLSVLSDDELANLDFRSALSIANNDLSDSEKQQLKRIFDRIRDELGIRHHGVKGMKWGVRRYQNKDGTLTEVGKRRLADNIAKTSIFGTAQKYSIKTRTGDTISVEPVSPPSTATKILNAILGTSDKDDLGRRGDANYTLNDSSGNKIGELSLISKSADIAYIDWITISETQRGKGYATDIINDLINKAKESGYSKIEMNALKKPRPLYERLGFTYQDRSKVGIIDRICEFEFGTKRMEYNLKTAATRNDTELYHYGVKGMKWGVRKKYSEGAQESRRTARLRQQVDHQRTVVDSWKDSAPIKDKRGKTIMSKRDCQDICDAAIRRLGKLEYKLLVSHRRDMINAGESVAGRIYNKLTSADKYQAQIEIDIEKRARANKAWRD